MPGAADTQQLDINTAGFHNFFLVVAAKSSYIIFFDASRWDVNVFGFDINVLEKPVPHKMVVTLLVVVFQGIVLIEVKGDHIRKTETFFAMPFNQFIIHHQRC